MRPPVFLNCKKEVTKLINTVNARYTGKDEKDVPRTESMLDKNKSLWEKKN